jgi:aryl-phospho-beta-D-glucosidase BglC (GH1 family)
MALALASCGGGADSTGAAPAATTRVGVADPSAGNGPPASYTISGSVSGLSGTGLVVQTNGGNALPIRASGSYAFATLPTGSAYAVTVQTAPTNPSQACTIANGTGIVASANISGILISCATSTYTISGNVTGVLGTGLILQTNGGNNVSVFGSGSYVLAALASGSAYAITVLNQPTNPAQTCAVIGGSGTVGASNVGNVSITCATPPYATSSSFATKTLRGFSAPGDTSTQSMSDLAATGANLVRVFLSLDQSGSSYAIDAASLSELNAVIAAGAQQGFKVVICFGPPDNSYFTSSALQASIDTNWQIIAKMYHGNLTVAGYDLINEPISPSPGGVAAWTTLASQWITDIRTIDPEHVIIFEPTPGGIPEAFTGLKPLPFSNIVYSTHMYEPYQFSSQGLMFTTFMSYPTTSSSIGTVDKATVSSILQPIRDFVTAYNLPVYVGEFSAVRWAPDDSSNTYVSDLISLFEAEGYSWTYHCWRGYQGWDAELPESWFYTFPFADAKPQSFGTTWPPPRTSDTDTMNVLRGYFQLNSN